VPNPDPRQTLVEELRRHALVIGEVTLTSGATAQYYVDAKRAILLPTAFSALGQLVRAEAERAGATAVGPLFGEPVGQQPKPDAVQQQREQGRHPVVDPGVVRVDQVDERGEQHVIGVVDGLPEGAVVALANRLATRAW
jgi:orotate phosphoribosyltransferase